MITYLDFIYLSTMYRQLGNFGNFGNFATQNLDMTKALMDCYYYYYSTCRKGSSCPYRHEPSALGHEVMCNRWLEDRCFNIKCPNRHMKIQKKRNQIQCFWENRSGGCKKPHCVFLHSQTRNNIRSANRNSGSNVNHHHRIDNHHQDKRAGYANTTGGSTEAGSK